LLARSEAAGGHLLARHVGKTTAELSARLASQSRIPAASTFASAAEAQAAMNGVLSVNSARVSAWAAAGARGRLAIDGAFSGGSVLVRGASASTAGTAARAVLQGNGSGGWHILTGFPLR
jgi:CDI toxin RNase A-like protein